MVRLKKLRGSTLIETLISMTILLVITGISFMLFYKITNHGMYGQRLEARFILKKFTDSTIAQKNFMPDSSFNGILKITKTVNPWSGNSDVSILHFSVFDQNGLLLWEERRMVLNEANEKN